MSNIRDITKDKLLKLGIPLHPHLPIRSEKKASRPASQVAKQIVILNALDGLVNDTSPSYLKRWLSKHGLWGEMELEDKNCFQKNLPTDTLNELSWKCHSLYTLAWAVGIVKALHPYQMELSPGVFASVYDAIPPVIDFHVFVRDTRLIPDQSCIHSLSTHYA